MVGNYLIYIDKIRDYSYLNKKLIHGTYWCHMWSDSVEELHKFAEKIGLKKSWFQNKIKFPHYDLTPSKREIALHYGAKEYSLKKWIIDQRLKNSNNQVLLS